jgi:hypothetical protein
MALIVFDLSNETILQAVVKAVAPSEAPKHNFQEIVKQAEDVLVNAGLSAFPEKVKIQFIRTLRNDAMHRAKYPNKTDVSDCRTYTRDFLKQIILDVWGEKFESLSLTDIISDIKVKSYLQGAETELRNGNFREAVIKSMAGFEWTQGQVRNAIVGNVSPWVDGIVVTESFKEPYKSTEVFRAFQYMRDLLMNSVIGLHFPGYLRYIKIVNSVAFLQFMADGSYDCNLEGHDPDANEAEFVVDYAVNAVLQIESLVGDVNKPFEI